MWRFAAYAVSCGVETCLWKKGKIRRPAPCCLRGAGRPCCERPRREGGGDTPHGAPWGQEAAWLAQLPREPRRAHPPRPRSGVARRQRSPAALGSPGAPWGRSRGSREARVGGAVPPPGRGNPACGGRRRLQGRFLAAPGPVAGGGRPTLFTAVSEPPGDCPGRDGGLAAGNVPSLSALRERSAFTVRSVAASQPWFLFQRRASSCVTRCRPRA